MATADQFVIKAGEKTRFTTGMVRSDDAGRVSFYPCLEGPMFKRWAAHLCKGKIPYPDVAPGVANWQLAETPEELQRAKESALRHMVQWVDGETDEDHAAAVYFNINVAENIKAKINAKRAAETAVNEERAKNITDAFNRRKSWTELVPNTTYDGTTIAGFVRRPPSMPPDWPTRTPDNFGYPAGTILCGAGL